ncbi:MAG: sigma-54-dependent Fis family transcriptional regulator [Fibrobacter sp.]|nr:sigma-54-dependent Fis family transcriptional regulator [Fibrobacter sp.]
MKNLDELLRIAAKSTITVLLQGESGAGKEVAARQLHKMSDRRDGPFVAVNCGAIPSQLVESTLEGSQRGAYTGATNAQTGMVRAAEGGTLFLDEIGEMPYNMQSRLLRILQEHTIRPLGSTENIPVNFRLVCATNKDLKSEVAQGNFREDLFFRLNAFPITIPPLRERSDFDAIAKELWKELDENEIRMLRNEQWPGNIRQLKNVIQRYALLKPHGYSLADILDDEFAPPNTKDGSAPYHPETTGENALYANERARAPEWDIIEKAIECHGGNKSQAAQSLGISRGCLVYQIKKRAIGAPQANPVRN